MVERSSDARPRRLSGVSRSSASRPTRMVDDYLRVYADVLARV